MRTDSKIILSGPRLSDVFTSFQGPLIQFHVVRSIDRNKGFLRRWTVISNGRRPTLVRYLFGKWLHNELNSLESLLFWSLSEVTRDTTIYVSLKAFTLGVPKKTIRKNLARGSFLGLWYITRQQYLTIKGRVNYVLKEETVSLRNSPKYSGYTKHYKDKGSLRKEVDASIDEVLDPIQEVSIESLLKFLSVGEITLFRGSVLFPEENQLVRNGSQKRNDYETEDEVFNRGGEIVPLWKSISF